MFLEYGHVAYQIKGKDTYSIMVANIFPVDTLDSRFRTTFPKHFFSETSHVVHVYQIKGNGA